MCWGTEIWGVISPHNITWIPVRVTLLMDTEMLWYDQMDTARPIKQSSIDIFSGVYALIAA
jgi:hypothetical protein